MAESASDATFARLWEEKTFVKDIPKDIGPFRELLERWGGVHPNDQDKLLRDIRDKAWNVHKFPCLGMWHFTNLRKLESPQFQQVIERLKAPGSKERFLDVGCCLGEVQRYLAYKGVNPKMLYGVDRSKEFIELGFDLFDDRDKFPKGRFYKSDILNPTLRDMEWLSFKFTLVHVTNMFHLHDREGQFDLGMRIVDFIRRHVKDVVIFGGMLGNPTGPEEIARRRFKMFLNNQESFQNLWDEIGEESGTKWKVEVQWVTATRSEIPGLPQDSRYMWFKITRA